MITIYGGVRVDPTLATEITERGIEFQRECQAEAGCLAYLLSWDIEPTHTVRLLEAWADEESYLAHKATDHVRVWTGYIAERAVEPPAFTRHDC